MAKTRALDRVLGVLEETRLNRMGACLLEKCGNGEVYLGLCAQHYRAAVEGRLEAPAGEKCGVRWCTAEGSAFCAEHDRMIRAMRKGELAKAVDGRVDLPEEEIPIAEIHPGWLTMRFDLRPEDAADLAGDIESVGLVVPIIVTPDAEKGGYLLVDGLRRWTAVKQIPGRKTIRARVAPKGTSEIELVRLASASNFQRQWIAPFAKSVWMVQLRDRHRMRTSEIASAMNLTEREVQYHFNALEGTHLDVLRAYAAGRLKLRTAVAIARWPEDEQPAVLARALAEGSDRRAQEKAVEAARHAALRRAFEAWLRNPGPGYERHGGGKGKQKLCMEFEGLPELFGFFASWVWPRLQAAARAAKREREPSGGA